MITIFKNIHSTATPFWRPIDVILQRIRDGNSKTLVKEIRMCHEKEMRNKLKQQLPSICFSGKFSQREDGACLEHSGYICLDFDNFPDDDLLRGWRDKLKCDPFVFSLFTSPSGNGLKVIVRIPAAIEQHKNYFKSLAEHFDCDFFDISTSNISRVCYESYDPDIYINPEAEIYTDKEEDEHFDYETSHPILPVRSESLIIQKLQKWFDRKFSMAQGERNVNLFKFAFALNEFGISESEAKSYLSQYVTTDFTQREVDRVVISAYSKKDRHNIRFFEDNQARDQLKKSIQTGSNIKKVYKKLPKYTPDEIDMAVEHIQSSSTVTEFWYTNDRGTLKISSLKLKTFLEQNGFCKYYPEGGDSFIFIRIENSFIQNTSTSQIKDFVLDYVLKKQANAVYELLTVNTKYFKEDYLSLIESKSIKLYEDTESYCMIYFQNTSLKIYKDKIEQIDYLNLDGMVWKHHVIERDYKEVTFDGCIFDRFLNLVANKENDRKLALQTVIGYMLSSYKTSANNKAIVFNDERISENPNGGSGKGIICNAVGQLKRTCILDGKQFDFNKSFPYQTVSADTQLLIFDDVKKNFSFENLFSLITEGITLEKKNRDAIKIPVQRSPKIIITTNYTIGGVGGSFERRKHEVELASYFSPQHTPLDEFGIMLFDEFSHMEWSRFDNLMISCIQLYLNNGLIKHEFHNLGVRKFIADTSNEFREFVEDGGIEIGLRTYKSKAYYDFLDEYPDFKKWLSQKKFSKWIDNYALYLGKDTIHGKSQDGRWVIVGDEQNNGQSKTEEPIIF